MKTKILIPVFVFFLLVLTANVFATTTLNYPSDNSSIAYTTSVNLNITNNNGDDKDIYFYENGKENQFYLNQLDTNITGNHLFVDDNYLYTCYGTTTKVYHKNNRTLHKSISTINNCNYLFADETYLYISDYNVQVYNLTNFNKKATLNINDYNIVKDVITDNDYIYVYGDWDDSYNDNIEIWDKDTLTLTKTLNYSNYDFRVIGNLNVDDNYLYTGTLYNKVFDKTDWSNDYNLSIADNIADDISISGNKIIFTKSNIFMLNLSDSFSHIANNSASLNTLNGDIIGDEYLVYENNKISSFNLDNLSLNYEVSTKNIINDGIADSNFIYLLGDSGLEIYKPYICYEESVSNGADVICNWKYLTNETYEWFVNISGVTSSVWNFTINEQKTPPNIALNSPLDDSTYSSNYSYVKLNITTLSDYSFNLTSIFYYNKYYNKSFNDAPDHTTYSLATNPSNAYDNDYGTYATLNSQTGYIEYGFNIPTGNWNNQDINITYKVNNTIYTRNILGYSYLDGNTQYKIRFYRSSSYIYLQYYKWDDSTWVNVENYGLTDRIYELDINFTGNIETLYTTTNYPQNLIYDWTLPRNQDYYWYVTINDSENSFTTPTYTFTFDGNQAPNITLNSPTNGAFLSQTNTQIEFIITDLNNDNMDVTLYKADDTQLYNWTNQANGTTLNYSWSGLSRGDLYTYYINATDSYLSTKTIDYNFTINTQPNEPTLNYPTMNQRLPYNENVNLNVTVTDDETDLTNIAFNFDENDDGSTLTLYNTGAILNGSSTNYTWTPTSEGIQSWYVVVNDGTDTRTSSEYLFNINYLPTYTLVSPSDNSTTYNSDRNVTLQFRVYDRDLDNLTINIYNGSDDLINSTTATNNTLVQYTWELPEYNQTYEWYYTITDTYDNITSPTYNFTLQNNSLPTATPLYPTDGQYLLHNTTETDLNISLVDLDGDLLDVLIYRIGGFQGDCYQAKADAKSSCGGLSTGNYSYTKVSENKLNIFVNYTKPIGAKSSEWQVKWGYPASKVNITIPYSCFNYYDKDIYLKLELNAQTNPISGSRDATWSQNTSVVAYCYNSSWIEMNKTEGNYIEALSYSSSLTNPIPTLTDENFNNHLGYVNKFGGRWNAIYLQSNDIYEEGMYWNISNKIYETNDISPQNISFNWYALDENTTYNYYVNVTDSAITTSSNYSFIINTLPTYYINYPINNWVIGSTNPRLNLTLYDKDLQDLNITFYDHLNATLNSQTGFTNSSTAQYIWSNLKKNTRYKWGYEICDELECIFIDPYFSTPNVNYIPHTVQGIGRIGETINTLYYINHNSNESIEFNISFTTPLNSTYFNTTFNETSFIINTSTTKYINLSNIIDISTPEATYNGIISLKNLKDNVTYLSNYHISVATAFGNLVTYDNLNNKCSFTGGDVCDLNTIVTTSDSVFKSIKVKNDGDYELINCKPSLNGDLTNLSVLWSHENFDLPENEELPFTYLISGLSTGNYFGWVDITCQANPSFNKSISGGNYPILEIFVNPATPTSGGGDGGGGSPSSEVIVIKGDLGLKITDLRGSERLDFYVPTKLFNLDTTRTKELKLTNIGNGTLNLDLECEDIIQGSCEFITLSQTETSLKPNEEIQLKITFDGTNAKDKDYQFNILALDSAQFFEARYGIKAKVSILAHLTKINERLVEERLGVPIWTWSILTFIVALISSAILFLAVTKKQKIGLAILISSAITFILFILI